MLASAEDDVVRTVNAAGASPFVLVCDHASKTLPARYGDMGLSPADLESHIAWDIGALGLCEALAARLDAPLVHSTVSRLVIDTNRRRDASNLIWTLSEATSIPANLDLDAAEIAHRVAAYYTPFHDAVDALLDARAAAGRTSVLVCVHTFTPVFLGVFRPWHAGVIHGRDTGFSERVLAGLRAADPALAVGWNEPYSAADGVTETLERHGDARGIEGTMIEIRNNEVAERSGAVRWAGILAGVLDAVEANAPAGRTGEARG